MRLLSVLVIVIPLLLAVAAAADNAAPPKPALRLKDGHTGPLRVAADQPVTLELDLDGETWRSANIGQLAIRTPGKQHNLEPDEYERDGGPRWTFDEPGYAMILLAAGPANAKGHPDSWRRTTRCTKLIVAVEPATPPRNRRTPALSTHGLTAKAGQRIEILPLMSPPRIRPGGELPVRVYFDASGSAGRAVSAFGPQGVEQRRASDASGFVTFEITASGPWLIRFDHTEQGIEYRAELVFEIP